MSRVAVRLGLAVLLLAAAYGLFQGRKQFIASFFAQGPGGAPPPPLAAPPPPAGAAAGPGPAPRVRVALLDGVDRVTADRLPSYRALCQRGLALTVDVGFPTVSLPVQAVLWTGLTQQQSGIEFVQARIDPPPPGSLPAQVPGSAAVSDTHPFISGSFGFARTWPPLETAKEDLAVWKATGFPLVARAQVAGAAPLVFVHVVAPDSAGHGHGRDAPEFAAAAAAADRLLGDLLALDRAVHGEGSRWLVLADHGHRGPGGHGGAERDIRLVRACLAGAGVTAPAGQPPDPPPLVHLVDLSRALADSLGLAPAADSTGRPLGTALAAGSPAGATLPRPGALRWAIAGALLLAAVIGSWLAAGWRAWRLPWWWALAYVSVVSLETVPTLSTPMIYRPLGQTMYMAALPGLLLLAIVAGAAVRQTGPVRVALSQLLLPAAGAAAALVLCWRTPPLMPVWTAHLSLFLVLLFTGAAVVALAVLASLVPFASDRGSRPGSPGTSP